MFVIFGKLWTDKNGNTYHTAKVWVNGEYVGQTNIAYGYGNQYLETAAELLREKGYIPEKEKMPFGFSYWCRENSIKLITDYAYVATKKEVQA